MTIYRYPLKPPVDSGGIDSVEGPTDAIDYLVLKRSRIHYDGTTSDQTKIHHLGNAGVAGGKKVRRQYMRDCVYLAMPPQLSTSYQAAYSQQDLGIMGMALAEGLHNGKDFDALSNTIQAAAGAGLPEFAAAQAVNVANAFGGMLGLAGKADANSLMQLNKGKVFNPFSEQIFKSMAFRQHQFTFKMLARSHKEAEMIQDIIDWIKEGATPRVEAGNSDWKKDFIDGKGKAGGARNQDGTKNKDTKLITDGKDNGEVFNNLVNLTMNQRFFQIPDHFDLRFIRVDPGNPSSWWNPTGGSDGGFKDGSGFQSMHFKIHPSFCNNVGVNYTPDGQYTSFKHIKTGNQIQVPAIQLNLQFIETRLVSQQNIQQGF